jgi:hypothetical protein
MRRPRLEQYIPTGPEPMFQELEHRPEEPRFFHITLRDAISSGHEPIFRYQPPKKSKHPPFTIQQIANAAAGELNEARGLICIQEFVEGIPVFTAMFASNSRQVYCLHSSDQERAPSCLPLPVSFPCSGGQGAA